MLGKYSFYVLSSLLQILRDYPRDHSLLYEILKGHRGIEVRLEVAQSSILELGPRNASYNNLLLPC